MSLTLLIGIPGSGKSRWIKQNAGNMTVICPDLIRQELHGTMAFNPKNESKVWAITYERLVAGLNAGNDVVLDATNVKSQDRQRTLKWVDKMARMPYTTKAVVFAVEPSVSKSRIKQDISANVNRSHVPDKVIDRMYADFIDGYDDIVIQFDIVEYA